MSWQNTLKVEKSDPTQVLQGIAALFGIAIESVKQIVGKVKSINITKRLESIIKQFSEEERVKETYPVEVMTKHLKVEGKHQVVSGYVLDSIGIYGVAGEGKHELNIIAPIGVEVIDWTDDSKVNIERIPREDIAKRIIEDKEWE